MDHHNDDEERGLLSRGQNRTGSTSSLTQLGDGASDGVRSRALPHQSPDEMDHRAFLLSIAEIRGCFRVRHVFCLLNALFIVQLVVFWALLVTNFEGYLRRSSSSICTSTAAAVDAQLNLFQSEVFSRMYVATNIIEAIVDSHSEGNAMLANVSLDESGSSLQFCNSFYGGFLAIATYYANGTRLFYGECAAYTKNPTLRTEMLPATALRPVTFELTSGSQTITFAVYTSTPNSANGATYTVMFLLSKKSFGWMMLGAEKSARSTGALFRGTNVLIATNTAVIVNTLNDDDTPEYTTTQPTGTAQRLYGRYHSTCADGMAHTWQTQYNITSGWVPNTAVKSLPQVSTDDSVAVLCGRMCVAADSASSGSTSNGCVAGGVELRVVIETPVVDSTGSIEAFKQIASSGTIIVVLAFAALALSITVPIGVLNRRIVAVLSGVPSKHPTLDRFLIRCTRRFWIRDIVALLRQFHIMSLFFIANKKYVPPYVLAHQMKQLRGEKEIEKLLASLTLVDWASSPSPRTSVGDSSLSLSMGLPGEARHGNGSDGVASSPMSRDGLDDELEMLHQALSMERNLRHHHYHSTQQQQPLQQHPQHRTMTCDIFNSPQPMTSDSLRAATILPVEQLTSSLVHQSAASLRATPRNPLTVAPEPPLGDESRQGSTNDDSDFSARDDDNSDVHSSNGGPPRPRTHPRLIPEGRVHYVGGVAHSATSSMMPNMSVLTGRSLEISYVESATLLCVSLDGVAEAFEAAFDVTARQHKRIFTAMYLITRRHRGNVYDFTGERICVSWNAFEARPDHALCAVKCAREFESVFHKLRKKSGLRMGIAVHQGPVVCGVAGDHRAVSSVLFGKAAMVVTRLAALGSQLASSIGLLVTDPVKQALSIFFEWIIVDVVRDNVTHSTLSVFDIRGERSKASLPPSLLHPNILPLPNGHNHHSSSTFVMEYTMAFTQFRAHQFSDALVRLMALQQAPTTTTDDSADPRLMRLIMLCQHCVHLVEHQRRKHVVKELGSGEAQVALPWLPRPYVRSMPQWTMYEDTSEDALAALIPAPTALIPDQHQQQQGAALEHNVQHRAKEANPSSVMLPRVSSEAQSVFKVLLAESASAAESTGSAGSVSTSLGTTTATLPPCRPSESLRALVLAHVAAKKHHATESTHRASTAFASELRSSMQLQQQQQQITRGSDRRRNNGVTPHAQPPLVVNSSITATTSLRTPTSVMHTAAAENSATLTTDGRSFTTTSAFNTIDNSIVVTAAGIAVQLFDSAVQRREAWGGASSAEVVVADNASSVPQAPPDVMESTLVEAIVEVPSQSVAAAAAAHDGNASAASPPQRSHHHHRPPLVGGSTLQQRSRSSAALRTHHHDRRTGSASGKARQQRAHVPTPLPAPSSASDAHALLPTRVVDSQGHVFIRSRRVLGTGSFGCVFMGMDQQSGRLVALKFLPLPADDAEVSLLQNEVTHMKAVVDHPNLVEFYGYAFVDNMIVLIMECMVAGSLSGMLMTFAALPELTTLHYVRDVLRGLSRLHAMGIVHRDVKPQNVLIGSNGHCKLSDFGASASIHELVRRCDGDAKVQGTPIYLAPEAARGHPHPKSDVWSVGIMALQLMTGVVPYDLSPQMLDSGGGGVGAVVHGIGSGRLRPLIPECVAPLAMQFIEGCLAHNIEDRLTAQQLLDLPVFSI